jgi:hypothetical protein
MFAPSVERKTKIRAFADTREMVTNNFKGVIRMKYSGKWYQRAFRYFQVKWYIKTKRYRLVENGINFYADIKKGGVGVKGLYWKPMSYATPMIDVSKTNVTDLLKALDSIQIKGRNE